MSGEQEFGGSEGCCGPDDADAATCCAVADHGLTDHDVAVDVQTLSALANETRYEALCYLAATDREVCACELVEYLDVNQSTISRALGALHRAGLLDRRKEGRWRYYGTTDRAEALLAAVDDARVDFA